MQHHSSQPAGVVLPRYRSLAGDHIVNADRIERVQHGVIELACGARVTLDDEVMDNGPSNTGDYLLIGANGEADKLMRGSEFVFKYAAIPHGLDIPEVSAALDPQAGSVNQPVNAADSENPRNANEVAVPHSNSDAVTNDLDRKALVEPEHEAEPVTEHDTLQGDRH